MGMEVSIDARAVRDVFDDIGSNSAVANNDTFVTLLSFTTRTGFLPRLSLLGANVDPGAEAYSTFRVLVNGSPITNKLYNNFTSSPGVIYDPGQRLLFPIELPQGALIQIQGKIGTGASSSYGMYVRARVEYADL